MPFQNFFNNVANAQLAGSGSTGNGWMDKIMPVVDLFSGAYNAYAAGGDNATFIPGVANMFSRMSQRNYLNQQQALQQQLHDQQIQQQLGERSDNRTMYAPYLGPQYGGYKDVPANVLNAKRQEFANPTYQAALDGQRIELDPRGDYGTSFIGDALEQTGINNTSNATIPQFSKFLRTGANSAPRPNINMGPINLTTPVQAPVPSAPITQPTLTGNATQMGGTGRYSDVIKRLSQKYGVNPNLVQAVMSAESGGNPNALSKAGAIGLMQLMPGTAKGLGINPNDPTQNIEGGIKYLAQNMKTFGGNLNKTVAAYNAGPEAVKKYGGIPPFSETQGYTKRVMSMYERLMRQNPPQKARTIVNPQSNMTGIQEPQFENMPPIEQPSSPVFTANAGIAEPLNNNPWAVGNIAPDLSTASTLFGKGVDAQAKATDQTITTQNNIANQGIDSRRLDLLSQKQQFDMANPSNFAEIAWQQYQAGQISAEQLNELLQRQGDPLKIMMAEVMKKRLAENGQAEPAMPPPNIAPAPPKASPQATLTPMALPSVSSLKPTTSTTDPLVLKWRDWKKAKK